MMHKHSQCMQYEFNKCAHLFAQMHTARNRGEPIACWYSWFCLENCVKLEKSVSSMNLNYNFYCDCVKICTDDDDVTWVVNEIIHRWGWLVSLGDTHKHNRLHLVGVARFTNCSEIHSWDKEKDKDKDKDMYKMTKANELQRQRII